MTVVVGNALADMIVVAAANASVGWRRRANTPVVAAAETMWDAAMVLAGIASGHAGLEVMEAPVRLSSGDFFLTAPLTVSNVYGVNISGAGKHQTRLRPKPATALTLSHIVKLDACDSAHLSDFSISAPGDGSILYTVTDAVAIEKTAGLASSHSSTVERILINGDVRFVNGLVVGRNSANLDLTDVATRDVYVSGSWVTGEATLWQRAFSWGSGVSGNVLIHSADSIVAGGCAVGLYVSATDVRVRNANLDSNGVDVYLNAAAKPFLLDGFRSETAGRLLSIPATGTVPMQAAIKNGIVSLDGMNTDGEFIGWRANGHLLLENVVFNAWPGTVQPKLLSASNGAGTVHITLKGVYAPFPLEDFISTPGGAGDNTIVDACPYVQTDASGNPVFGGTVWGGVTRTVTAAHTVLPVDGTVIANSAAATRAITLQQAAKIIGREVTVRREGINAVTVNRAGTDTINGATVVTLGSDNASATFRAVAAQKWTIVASYGTVT